MLLPNKINGWKLTVSTKIDVQYRKVIGGREAYVIVPAQVVGEDWPRFAAEKLSKVESRLSAESGDVK